jgi:hypothetical protein
MMTFLGHGSLTVLDMDFGSIGSLNENNKPNRIEVELYDGEHKLA